MSYDLTALLPYAVVFALLAIVGGIASIAALTRSVAQHHRTRVARRQTIPTYYRRLVAAH